MFFHVNFAWPWALGYFPPPQGQLFLVDDNGAILIDSLGNLLTVNR